MSTLCRARARPRAARRAPSRDLTRAAPARTSAFRPTLSPVEARERNNVRTMGPEDGPTMVFAHGFGGDQSMWRYVAPVFYTDHRVVLFHHSGCGASLPTAFDADRHSDRSGSVANVVE